MSDKIARLGIKRDNDLMYYVKNGDVWAVPRKQPGLPKGRPARVAATGLKLDYGRYIYFIDKDGDVARNERALGGGRRAGKAAKPGRSTRPTKSKSTPASPKKTGKSKAQLDREIARALRS